VLLLLNLITRELLVRNERFSLGHPSEHALTLDFSRKRAASTTRAFAATTADADVFYRCVKAGTSVYVHASVDFDDLTMKS